MRHRHPRLHSIHFWIERTEAHCPRETIDRVVGLAMPDLEESAHEPSRSQVWIKRERSVDERDAAIEVADKMGDGTSASRERDCIVPTQFNGPLCKVYDFAHRVHTG
jgi:hypothetical protein